MPVSLAVEPDFKSVALFNLNKKINHENDIKEYVLKKYEEAKSQLGTCSTSFTCDLIGTPLVPPFQIRVIFKAWKINPNDAIPRGSGRCPRKKWILEQK